MADTKISEMTAAVTAADADLVPIVQGGVNKKATVDLILDALTAARVATAIGSTAANLVYAGPSSGAAAVPAARSLVPDDIPASLPLTKLAALTIDRALVSSGAGVVSVSSVTTTELGYVSGVTSAIQTQLNAKQGLDATLTALAALDSSTGFVQQTGADTFTKAALTDTQINTALGYTAADAAALNATNLTLGTIPDARFPAVLPAISGANLTNLPGVTGVVSDAATNTVSDALVIQHATSGTAAAGFGTGLLWQGENAAGTMRDMASVDAVYTDATDGSEDTRIDFAVMEGGVLGTVARLIRDAGASYLTFTTWAGLRAAAGAGLLIQADDSINFYTGGGYVPRWVITPFGQLRPAADATYDFGSLALRALKIYAVTSGVQTANGAESNVKTISESITLATGGLTTDSTANLLPANSIILSVVARITTTITTTTDWALGDASEAARFASANATLTSGTTAVGLNHQKGGVATDAAGPVQTAAAKLRITCTGANPGAGTIRVTVTYLELTPPSS